MDLHIASTSITTLSLHARPAHRMMISQCKASVFTLRKRLVTMNHYEIDHVGEQKVQSLYLSVSLVFARKTALLQKSKNCEGVLAAGCLPFPSATPSHTDSSSLRMATHVFLYLRLLDVKVLLPGRNTPFWGEARSSSFMHCWEYRGDKHPSMRCTDEQRSSAKEHLG